MKLLQGVLVTLVLVSAGVAQEDFELPIDTSTPVITFNTSSFARKERFKNLVPQLQIFPDGRLLYTSTSEDAVFEINIGEEKLNEILDAVVHQYEFYDIDAKAIRECLDKNAKDEVKIKLCFVIDTKVDLGQGTHEVSLPYVWSETARTSEIESFENLIAIQALSWRYMVAARFGGYDRLEHILEQFNQTLAEKHPDIPALKMEQLTLSDMRDEEGLRVTFTANSVLHGNPVALRLDYTLTKSGKEYTWAALRRHKN